MKRFKLFVTGMAALALSFGLLMTGCDDGGGGSGGTTPPPPPPESLVTYKSVDPGSDTTVGTGDDTIFVLEVVKRYTPRAAYTPGNGDGYTLYVNTNVNAFDGATAKIQTGTITAIASGVHTLTPVGGLAAEALVATITGGNLTGIAKGPSNSDETIVFDDLSTPLAIASGFGTLTAQTVPEISGTVGFVSPAEAKEGVDLTVDVAGLTPSAGLKYRWLFKGGEAGAEYELIEDETNNTYIPDGEDVGGTITVIVSAIGYNGSKSVTSGAIQPATSKTIAFAATLNSGPAKDAGGSGLTALKPVTFTATGAPTNRKLIITLADGTVSTAVSSTTAFSFLTVGDANEAAAAGNMAGWTATYSAAVGATEIEVVFNGADATDNLTNINIAAAAFKSAINAKLTGDIDGAARGAAVATAIGSNASNSNGLVTLTGNQAASGSVTIPKGVTLDLGTRTLTLSGSNNLTVEGLVKSGDAGSIALTGTGAITVGTSPNTVVFNVATIITTAAETSLADGSTGTVTLTGHGNSITLGASGGKVTVAGMGSLNVGTLAAGLIKISGAAIYTAESTGGSVFGVSNGKGTLTGIVGDELAVDAGTFFVGTSANSVTLSGATLTSTTTITPFVATPTAPSIILADGNTLALAPGGSVTVTGTATFGADDDTDSITFENAAITAGSDANTSFAAGAAGAIVLEAGDAIALATGGKITTAGSAGGSITAGFTTFDGLGTWTATGAPITITSSAAGAAITGSGGTLTASGTPVITQGLGSDNNLEIGAGVTIALAGTSSGVAGAIKLETGTATNAANVGKLTLAGAGASITTANTGGGTAMSSAAGGFSATASDSGKIIPSGLATSNYATITGNDDNPKVLKSIVFGDGTVTLKGNTNADGAFVTINAATTTTG